MRVAEICPTCTTYINATCIAYGGEFLSNLDIEPLETLDAILVKINDNFAPLSGTGAPTGTPRFIGQFYVDTATPTLYYARGTNSSADWVSIVNDVVPVTTTTTTTT
jgi:hypothetical protein